MGLPWATGAAWPAGTASEVARMDQTTGALLQAVFSSNSLTYDDAGSSQVVHLPRDRGVRIAVGRSPRRLSARDGRTSHAVTAPVSLSLCAVMCSAWFGGFDPGLLATTISILAFEYNYAAPLYTLAAGVEELPSMFRCWFGP